jgi:hypothetical protein
MKYLKKYESFKENDELLLDIKDILIELEDLDFNIEYSKSEDHIIPWSDEESPVINIIIKKNASGTGKYDSFYIDENVGYVFKRLANFLDKDLFGYWNSGSSGGVKFYVYRDERGIRTNSSRGNTKMDEKWPSISSLRLIVPNNSHNHY